MPCESPTRRYSLFPYLNIGKPRVLKRAKGIIAKPMPENWYSARANMPKDNDTPEEAEKKAFNRRIAAANKPYFMTYVYPSLRTKNNTYIRNNNYGAIMRFNAYGINSVDDLRAYEPKTKEMTDYLKYYDKFMPVGYNPCVVNRMCWIFEKEFNGLLSKKRERPEFDYSILKSNVGYSKKSYNDVLKIFVNYQNKLELFLKESKSEKIDAFESHLQRQNMISLFRRSCEMVCTNEHELCDIVIDICYKTEKNKQFAWDICGEVILSNLLKNRGNVICYPEKVDSDGEFEYCGEQFVMREKVVDDGEI